MQYSLIWESKDNLFVFSIIFFASSFVSYFFISDSSLLKSRFSEKFGHDKSLIYFVYFQRLLAIVFFGVIPSMVLYFFSEHSVSSFGLNFNNFTTSLYWTLGLSAILIIMNYFNCKKPDNLKLYPQIRVEKWSVNILVYSAVTWVAYLFAYEFMFRGFLLFVFLKYMGVWSAIALNVAIYSFVHIPKGIKEAVGALPLGILLGIITVQTGSIFVAFVVHVVLALSNEWLSLKVHPNIKLIVKSNKKLIKK